MSNPFGIVDEEEGVFDTPDPDKAEEGASALASHIGTRFQGVKRRTRTVLKPNAFLSSQKPSKFLRVSKNRKPVPIPSDTEEQEFKRKKLLSHLANLADVPPGIQEEFIKQLKLHTEAIRDFLVTQIAPFEVGMEAALEEASEALELVTGTKNAKIEFSRPRRIADKMSELKTVDFLCKQFSVPDDLRKVILEQFSSRETPDEKLSLLRTLSTLYQAK
jgi:hypothetical protein